jgi:hypothetical protein
MMPTYNVRVSIEKEIELDDGLSKRQIKDAVKNYFVDPEIYASDVTVMSFEEKGNPND